MQALTFKGTTVTLEQMDTCSVLLIVFSAHSYILNQIQKVKKLLEDPAYKRLRKGPIPATKTKLLQEARNWRRITLFPGN